MDSQNFVHAYEISLKGLVVIIDNETIKFDISSEDSYGNRLTTDEYVCLKFQESTDEKPF